MRLYRWKPLDWPGFETLELDEERMGIRARGMTIGTWNGFSSGASYHITLGSDWCFRAINLQRLDGMRLRLRADGKGNWTDGSGAPLPALKGCIDIDLSASPFTNTLPIRRAVFEPGESQRFRTAFIALDTLEATPHVQSYTKIEDTRFRYRSETTGFETEIAVDADGLVLSYPGLFERVEN